jgi:hypothetical protein
MSGYGVAIELNGKTRRLRYDLNAFADLEEKLDSAPTEFEEKLNSFTAVRALIWAGLTHEEPELTEREVGQWIGPGGLAMADAIDKVRQALEEAFGDENPPMPRPRARKAGTGKK